MAGQTAVVIDAVIFDLDGVLVDSEHLWDEARRRLVDEAGGRWVPDATQAMMGMSSGEWSAYVRDTLQVPLSAATINDRVVEYLLQRYELELPLIPGATAAVRRMAERWPLGLASSSNRQVIDRVLVLAGLDHLFAVTVSSEEVGRGKPAPDVYLEAARVLGVVPRGCAVVEDSANGIRSGVAAGMTVVAVPNPRFPPSGDVLATADVVLSSIAELGPATLQVTH